MLFYYYFCIQVITYKKTEKMTKMVNTTNLVIGERIKQELKKQGKTSVWLAKQLGCHRTNIYKVYGRPTIDTGMLFHISQLLNFDFFKLYTDVLNGNHK